jgi:hypothetical protein
VHRACMGNSKGAYRVLVQKPEGKRQLRKLRHTREDNIKMYLLESGLGSTVSIATGYGLDGPGTESRWGRDLPLVSRLALGPTQPPVQ